MKIKEFEEKYNINFDKCFTYDALLKLSQKLNNIPESQRDEFINDFMTIKIC